MLYLRGVNLGGSKKVQKMSLQSHQLVLGGAASGKSVYAERLVTDTGLSRIYIATAQAYDAEMASKIAEHQRARGPNWRTLEVPMDLPEAVTELPKDHAVLLDCATLWLTNLLVSDADVPTRIDALFEALGSCPSPVTIVSNEVGQGIVPDNAMARQFRNIQGRFNQRLAAAVGRVTFVTAGLPHVLKPT